MLKLSLVFPLMLILIFSYGQQSVTLPNGWRLTPAGKTLPLGDLPLNIAVSSSKKLMAVTNNGQSIQEIQLIDVRTDKILDHILVPKSWLGLKFSADEKNLFVSGGNDNRILQYSIDHNKLRFKDSILLGKKWPEKISPGGIDLDDARHLLYVVTKDNNLLYVLDLNTKKIISQHQLPAEAYTCLLSPDKRKLYITCWGCDKLLVFDTKNKNISTEITVGDNPNDICESKDGKYLYIANANDNSVSVVSTRKEKVIETLTASLFPSAPAGSTSNGVALSEDEKTLYIANADNNCLALFDVSVPGSSKAKGFIPTGWYPTCVKVIGKKIYVANGKGFNSMANPNGPNPTVTASKLSYHHGDTTQLVEEQYIAGLFKGTLSIIDEPSVSALVAYSKQVYSNTPYTKLKETETSGEDGNPIPKKTGGLSPIKYVFYIIKENRTYDQVLGDVEQGNGDTALVLFGQKVTPNQHKLVNDFVLLDNFYVDGEVSADGHNWSMGGYATDYLEKNWVTSYGGRGGEYDAEGTRVIANNKTGFIWDHCNRAGVSYRTYGEFADDYKPNIPVLKGHYCTYYTSWDQRIRDTTRVNQWKRDFDSLVAANALPRLNTLRLINDHTEGMSLHRPTPFAHVADNDLSVGMFIDFLSHSPVWKESVVFILEDDAQDGPDHVDAHRSTAYIAGPYVRRNFVDHTPYSTTGLLRTIELILGIPPMSQYDAAAEPMWRCFTSKSDLTPFTALAPLTDITKKNMVRNELSDRSAKFDLSKEDRIPDQEFSEVIWKGVKGLNSIMPAPKRSAFLRTHESFDKD
ncbi:MAG: bifunctional YncE family protein/alkaline phosphatase family protein [Ginsengibacter sp.]